MRRFELVAAATGVVIAALLTWSAYYSNSHNGAWKISELVFLVLFPSSLGLMVTENATSFGQAVIVLMVVVVNGVYYVLISAVVRTIFFKK